MNGAPYTLHLGDCREVLSQLGDNSVDSIVTDPPYELGFMGKGWDKSGIANNAGMWAQCMRVLKPGGHLLAFSGSRTYHRMVCAIEDAGFEVRDQIMWLYGSGFPKSMDVSKAIDKAPGVERAVLGVAADFARDGAARKADGSHVEPHERQGGHGYGDRWSAPVTAPGSDAARQWSGWGTALKPAHEPICVARKPLVGTVAANVLEHGTGAINIDASRVPTGDKLGGGNNSADVSRDGRHEGWKRPWMNDADAAAASAERSRESTARAEALGRWPANVIHDGSPEVLEAFPEAPGQMARSSSSSSSRKDQNVYGAMARGSGGIDPRVELDKSAARFFYCAKASRADRNDGLPDPGPQLKQGNTLRYVEVAAAAGELSGNTHPTVKPTDLMAYLCRLVTPAGGVVLDPFMGSGSTGKAAMREGFRFIGIDMTPEYVEIARARIDASWRAAEAVRKVCAPAPQLDLFAI